MKNNSAQVTLHIAPCGMNCSLCIYFLREKNPCPGCLTDHMNKPKYCIKCTIKNCALLGETASGFCYECSKYPCTRLKQLDKRYRLKYHMSMLDNLETIRNKGLAVFTKEQKAKWGCNQCGAMICVHQGYCLKCKAASQH